MAATAATLPELAAATTETITRATTTKTITTAVETITTTALKLAAAATIATTETITTATTTLQTITTAATSKLAAATTETITTATTTERITTAITTIFVLLKHENNTRGVESAVYAAFSGRILDVCQHAEYVLAVSCFNVGKTCATYRTVFQMRILGFCEIHILCLIAYF
jgi:hypothetical protein